METSVTSPAAAPAAGTLPSAATPAAVPSSSLDVARCRLLPEVPLEDDEELLHPLLALLLRARGAAGASGSLSALRLPEGRRRICRSGRTVPSAFSPSPPLAAGVAGEELEPSSSAFSPCTASVPFVGSFAEGPTAATGEKPANQRSMQSSGTTSGGPSVCVSTLVPSRRCATSSSRCSSSIVRPSCTSCHPAEPGTRGAPAAPLLPTAAIMVATSMGDPVPGGGVSRPSGTPAASSGPPGNSAAGGGSDLGGSTSLSGRPGGGAIS
mmetsp:Transcript_87962/g.249308  ORF Transcript_87962/g.249308 Transcript_87962/m.249308 type:complete len:267 (-) Transcript_87962:30-830(-)